MSLDITLELQGKDRDWYIYLDRETGATFKIKMSNISWTYEYRSNSSELLEYASRIIHAFEQAGMKQHTVLGGFDESIKTLKI